MDAIILVFVTYMIHRVCLCQQPYKLKTKTKKQGWQIIKVIYIWKYIELIIISSLFGQIFYKYSPT